MTPPEVYRLDLDALSGRMDVTQRGAEGDHIEVGIDVEDQAALQTSVDRLDRCFLAEELAIGIRRSLEDSRLGVRLPAWVGVGEGYLSAAELEGRSNHLARAVAEARRRAALTRRDDDLAVTLLDGGKVIGGLYEVLHLVAHTKDAVGASVERAHQAVLGLAVDDLAGGRSLGELEAHLRIDALELCLDVLEERLEELLSLSLILGTYTDEGVCLARDGVVEVPPSDLGQRPATQLAL